MAESVIEHTFDFRSLEASDPCVQSFEASANQHLDYAPEPQLDSDALKAEEIHVIEHAKDGDSDAFEKLYAIHQPAIYSWLRKLNDPHTAEDLTQETFLRAFKYLQNFTDWGEGMGPWLQTIARNVSIDAGRRKDATHLQYTDDERMLQRGNDDFAAAVVGRVALTSTLVPVLDKMEDTFSDAIESIVIKGEAYADYSARVGIPKGTALSRVSRGRKQLQKMRAQGQIEI